MVAKYILPALAAVSAVAAQSNSCSFSATTTITNAQQATGLSGCRTVTGTIAIATSASGTLALDGIEEIKGSLIADDVTELTQLSAGSLQTITEDFELSGLTVLSTLQFPVLTSVNVINWTALPALSSLTFNDEVQTASQVSITNTFLSTLQGINLQEVDDMTLANNRFLNDVTMQLGNVSQQLTLSANGRNVSAQFPNLIWAANMTINNVSTFAVPSLQTINGTMGMNFNYFDSVSAANLTNVGGTLSFVSNSEMTNLTFPVLTKIGGALQIANNTDLEEINGFPKLQFIGGALDCSGDFKSAEFPSINNVVGAFNLQSSQNITATCNSFEPKEGVDNDIKGKVTCMQTNNPTSTLNGQSSGTSGGSTSSSGAANPLLISGATGLLGVVAAIFGLL